MDTERLAYRIGVRAREALYRRALDSIPSDYLPRHDVQRAWGNCPQGQAIYYKTVENSLEEARARVIWYCSYVAAGIYDPDKGFERAVLGDPYETFTDVRWIGILPDGKVIATARSLKADDLGRFQIHDENAGFGSLSLPEGSLYGSRLPEAPDEWTVTREISAFAVDLAARSWRRDALIGLIKVVLNDFQDSGVANVYTSIDESLFLLVNHMGLRLEQVGRKNYYMGSVVVPAFFQPARLIENLMPDHPALHHFMTWRGEFPPESRYAFYHCGSSPVSPASGASG